MSNLVKCNHSRQIALSRGRLTTAQSNERWAKAKVGLRVAARISHLLAYTFRPRVARALSARRPAPHMHARASSPHARACSVRTRHTTSMSHECASGAHRSSSPAVRPGDGADQEGGADDPQG
ncbi:hypothetical protein OAO87_01385 [bacterium]|nr:hypothetical protein [bacterium]